jgi:hypothetical protein
LETDNLARASEELLANCADDVVFEPQAAHGRVYPFNDDDQVVSARVERA